MLPTNKNIVLGSGHIYFDIFDDDGNLTGECYLAETPGFEISMETESIEVDSSDTPSAEVIADIATKITRNATLLVKSMSAKVFCLFIIGEIGSITTIDGDVTAENINAGKGITQDRWYQLGVDSTQPTGVRNITTLVIKEGAAIMTGYTADLLSGRIHITPGGDIADDAIIKADYHETASTWEEIKSQNTGAKKGALRYIADNTYGENRDLYIPLAALKPSGSVSFKSRDTIQEASFNVSISRPSDGRSAIYLNGRPA